MAIESFVPGIPYRVLSPRNILVWRNKLPWQSDLRERRPAAAQGPMLHSVRQLSRFSPLYHHHHHLFSASIPATRQLSPHIVFYQFPTFPPSLPLNCLVPIQSTGNYNKIRHKRNTWVHEGKIYKGTRHTRDKEYRPTMEYNTMGFILSKGIPQDAYVALLKSKVVQDYRVNYFLTRQATWKGAFRGFSWNAWHVWVCTCKEIDIGVLRPSHFVF